MTPDWLYDLLGLSSPSEGESVTARGIPFVLDRGILRRQRGASDAQEQSSAAFGFKWQQRGTFDSPASLARMRTWLIERYGDVEHAPWWDDVDGIPVIVDAGCGAGMSALELFGARIPRVHYVGVDVSEAVDVAAARFAERGYEAAFLQADLNDLPLPHGSVDVIFSEGVLHHADSTETALKRLVPLLKPGGRFLFYVYRRKGPIREFTDDHIRDLLQDMTPSDAWDALKPLSKLGQQLGELAVELDIDEPIDLLDIPAGRISLQRFFYWHVMKMFHHEDLTLDEMHHINFDWFAPRNAHRQSPEDVRAWCDAARLDIEREVIEPAGITVVAVKLA